ncbi:hypothetical protein [Patiriisocius marinus]|nr:hypothetical protein [Patiriisocius marinus]
MGYKKEESILFNNVDLAVTKDTKRVYILTEKECPTCNKEFALFMEQNLKDSTALFIINAKGLQVDISMFETPKSNVIRKKFKDPFFQKTKAIVLTNKKIDTILEINVKDKKNQFAFLNNLN